MSNELQKVIAALDKAGVAIGNEHETYTVAQRVKILAQTKDYFVRETDKARSRSESVPELKTALDDAIGIIESMQGQDNSCDPGYETEIAGFRVAIAKATL